MQNLSVTNVCSSVVVAVPFAVVILRRLRQSSQGLAEAIAERHSCAVAVIPIGPQGRTTTKGWRRKVSARVARHTHRLVSQKQRRLGGSCASLRAPLAARKPRLGLARTLGRGGRAPARRSSVAKNTQQACRRKSV